VFDYKLIKRSSLALSLVAFAFVIAPVCAAQASKDSKVVSALFSDVKTEAVQLKDDADVMKSFTHSTMSWQSHATKVNEIGDHINAVGKLLAKLENAKSDASPWQIEAIDRITPLMKELASNVQSTIDHLNQKPRALHTTQYVDYVAANYEMASTVTELISDYVDYGRSKAKAEELGNKLEVPGN
jgi:hypothetical protein